MQSFWHAREILPLLLVLILGACGPQSQPDLQTQQFSYFRRFLSNKTWSELNWLSEASRSWQVSQLQQRHRHTRAIYLPEGAAVAILDESTFPSIESRVKTHFFTIQLNPFSTSWASFENFYFHYNWDNFDGPRWRRSSWPTTYIV